jgi:hypothetical protein
MVMATVIWAAAAAVIIMDGAADAAITTAGRAVDIAITIKTRTGGSFSGGLLLTMGFSICD